MEKKNKNYLIVLAIIFASLLFSYAIFLKSASAATGKQVFDYKALETIPLVTTAGESVKPFNEYIGNLYTFLISAVGICALFMITVGGYMYITSAGNAAVLNQAKAIITDAIIGLLLALLSYLIFYTINPALVNPPGLTSPSTIIPAAGGSLTQSGAGGVPGSGAEGGSLVTSGGGGFVTADSRLGGQVPVTSSGNCVDPNNSHCTDTADLPDAAINRALTVDKVIPIQISGAAETGHASHGIGIDATDIQPVNGDYNQLGAYLLANKDTLGINKLCTTPQYSQYRINCTTDEETNHFHIGG